MSVIYKIYCLDENIKDCYIGSTTKFDNRKKHHKSDCNNTNTKNYNYKVYKFIRTNGGFENWDFEILETFNTIDKQDLHKIERKYIESNNSTLNCDIPTKTRKEWEQDNKTELFEKSKKYREKNREKLQEYRKKYREEHKEKINKKQNEKVECEFCKTLSTITNLKRHQQSNYCKSFQK